MSGGTGSALPIREVRASNKTGHNIAARGLMNISTANRGGLKRERNVKGKRVLHTTCERCLFIGVNCLVCICIRSVIRVLFLVATIFPENPNECIDFLPTFSSCTVFLKN